MKLLHRWHFPYRGQDRHGRRCKRVRLVFNEIEEGDLAYATLAAYSKLSQAQRDNSCGDVAVYYRVGTINTRRHQFSKWRKVQRP